MQVRPHADSSVHLPVADCYWHPLLLRPQSAQGKGAGAQRHPAYRQLLHGRPARVRLRVSQLRAGLPSAPIKPRIVHCAVRSASFPGRRGDTISGGPISPASTNCRLAQPATVSTPSLPLACPCTSSCWAVHVPLQHAEAGSSCVCGHANSVTALMQQAMLLLARSRCCPITLWLNLLTISC